MRRELMRLEGGALVIHNPGMREFGILDAEVGLGETFSNITALASGCRYRDCSHASEPGCAVLAAVNAGEISRAHYQNYLKLRDESGFHQMSYAERRKKDRDFGRFIKSVKGSLTMTRLSTATLTVHCRLGASVPNSRQEYFHEKTHRIHVCVAYGIMQAPGGPRDRLGLACGRTSRRRRRHGQIAAGFDGKVERELVLGRRTYQIFEAYWPYQQDDHPIAKTLNAASMSLRAR